MTVRTSSPAARARAASSTRRAVLTQVERRLNPEPHRTGPLRQTVVDVHGVLPVDEENVFFEDDAADLVAPDGDAGLEAELLEVAGPMQLQVAGRPLGAAEA